MVFVYIKVINVMITSNAGSVYVKRGQMPTYRNIYQCIVSPAAMYALPDCSKMP